MRARTSTLFVALLLAGVGASRAGDLDVHVILSGQVAPGVYGQVQFGSEPPPPVVYAQPMLIAPPPTPLPPVYLHVPPGHAKNWRKYCHEYHACNRPVYFVRSAEYDHFEHRDHEHEHGHDHDEDNHHGHDRDRDHHDHD